MVGYYHVFVCLMFVGRAYTRWRQDRLRLCRQSRRQNRPCRRHRSCVAENKRENGQLDSINILKDVWRFICRVQLLLQLENDVASRSCWVPWCFTLPARLQCCPSPAIPIPLSAFAVFIWVYSPRTFMLMKLRRSRTRPTVGTVWLGINH